MGMRVSLGGKVSKVDLQLRQIAKQRECLSGHGGSGVSGN